MNLYPGPLGLNSNPGVLEAKTNQARVTYTGFFCVESQPDVVVVTLTAFPVFKAGLLLTLVAFCPTLILFVNELKLRGLFWCAGFCGCWRLFMDGLWPGVTDGLIGYPQRPGGYRFPLLASGTLPPEVREKLPWWNLSPGMYAKKKFV